jgi:hypothetical protein
VSAALYAKRRVKASKRGRGRGRLRFCGAPRRARRAADDELRGEDQGLSGSATAKTCKEEFHGAFAHFIHWLGDHGQRRIHVAGPKRVVESNDRNLLGNSNLLSLITAFTLGFSVEYAGRLRGGRGWIGWWTERVAASPRPRLNLAGDHSQNLCGPLGTWEEWEAVSNAVQGSREA